MSKYEPRIYVGTYRRYNEGSLFGKWFDLEDYADADDFWEDVRKYHAAEIAGTGEIEPMFQDWEGIPERFISESHLDKDVWPEWVDLDEDDRELLEVYLEDVDQNGTLEKARDAYQGTFRSEADWAEDFLESTGGLEGLPDHLRNYIDFAAYGRDARLNGDVCFAEHDGDVWVFWNH